MALRYHSFAPVLQTQRRNGFEPVGSYHASQPFKNGIVGRA